MALKDVYHLKAILLVLEEDHIVLKCDAAKTKPKTGAGGVHFKR